MGPQVQFLHGGSPHDDLDLFFKVYSYDIDRSLNLPLVHGLKFAARPHKVSPHDVFFEEQDGHIAIFIWCNQQQDVRYPGCNLFDHYRNEIIEVLFDRKLLGEWRSIRDAVVSLLDRFAVSSGSKPGTSE